MYRAIVFIFLTISMGLYADSEGLRNPHKNVIIWGIAQHTDQLINFLKDAGSNVIGIVDSLPSDLSKPYEIVSKIKRIGQKNIPKGVSVVVGFSVNNEKGKKLLQKCVTYCKSNKIRLLHPAAFLPILPLKYKNRVKTYGLPGAGNVLFQNFLYNFLPTTNLPTEAFCSQIGFEYMEFIKDCIKSSFSDKNIEIVPSMHQDYMGLFQITSNNFEQEVFITNVPLYSFSWDKIVGGHGIPKHSVINFFSEKGFKNIQIIRHPLDNILSNLRKVRVLKKDQDYSDLSPIVLESQFLTDLFELCSIYYTSVLRNKKDLYIIKFEDITENPIPTFLKLCKFLNIKTTPEKIQAWYNKTVFQIIDKNSKFSRNHFTGGKSTWKKYFSEDWFSYFQEYDLIKISNELGYSLKKSEIKFPHKKNIEITKNVMKSLASAPLSYNIVCVPTTNMTKKLETPNGHFIYMSDPDHTFPLNREADLLYAIDMGIL